MDRSIINEKVKKIINSKDIPARFVPFVHIFFQKYAYTYNLTEQQLDEAIEKYIENIETISYINMSTGNIMYDERTKSLLLDTSLKENISEQLVNKLLKNSISQQAKAVLPKNLLLDFYGHEAFIEYNELDNLYENADPKITILLNMVRQSVGLNEQKIYQAISEEDEYVNGKKHYPKTYIRDILRCFDELKENNDIVTPDIFKKVYATCIVHYIDREDETGLEVEKSKPQIEKLMHEANKLKRIFGVTEQDLEDVEIKSDWKFPVAEKEKRFIEKFGISESEVYGIETEENEISRKLKVNRRELIQEFKNRKQNRNISSELIKQKVSEVMQRRQYIPSIEPILVAYFERSAKVYKWDEDDFIKKIENLERNVESFELDSVKKIEVDGEFDPLKRKIVIPKSAIYELMMGIKKSNELLNTLFHEIRHATDYTYINNIRYENGMHLKGETIVSNEECFNEIFVEGGAQLLNGTRYRGKIKTSLKFSGYEELSHGLSMMAAALGMTEPDLLKIGEKGHPKFIETIKSGNSSFEEKEKALAQLYTLTPKVLGTLKFTLKPEKTKMFAQMYILNQEIYNERIRENPPEIEEEQTKAEYEQYKIHKNLYDIARENGVDSKLLKELIGMDMKELKQKLKLTKEQKEAFYNISQNTEVLRYDNTTLNKMAIEVLKDLREQYKEKKKSEKLPKKQLPSGFSPTEGNQADKRTTFLDENAVSIQPVVPENTKKEENDTYQLEDEIEQRED